MEESVRSMLVYKKQADQLRQEKAALTCAFEVNIQKHTVYARISEDIIQNIQLRD